MGVHASSFKSHDRNKMFMSKLPQIVKNGASEETYVASEDQVKLSLSDESVSLPNEIIIVVLSFLSIEDLQNCARTCRLFRDLTLSSSLWKMKCIREKRFPYNTSYCPSDWRKFYLKQPFTRNLIRNASGQNDFQHWEIVKNGGDRFIVEPDKGHGSGEKPPELIALAGGKNCNFATSYGWCSKRQVIDLLSEGIEERLLDEMQPAFKVGEWYAARFDCGNIYSMKVTLLKENSEKEDSIIDFFTFGPLQTPQWAPSNWKEVSHIFQDYGPGLRYIKFEHESKDTQFWAGHYGAKMAGSYVKVTFET